jgi:hypothetical protein
MFDQPIGPDRPTVRYFLQVLPSMQAAVIADPRARSRLYAAVVEPRRMEISVRPKTRKNPQECLSNEPFRRSRIRRDDAELVNVTVGGADISLVYRIGGLLMTRFHP